MGWLKKFLAIVAVVLVFLVVLLLALYRSGYFNEFVKARFIQNLERIGIEFSAEEFTVTPFPLTLTLKDAKFLNKTNRENLFYLKSARIEMTIADLFSLSLSRKIDVKTTEIDGFEVWIKFDENGNSNFSGLNFVEEEGGYVELNYGSANLNLKNGLVHFGELKRRIEGEARNISLKVTPEKRDDSEVLYVFDFSSTDGHFVYDEKKVDGISINVTGKASHFGAEVTQLFIKSPVFEATSSGRIENWQDFVYSFDVKAKVFLEQFSRIFDPSLSLEGTGEFIGKLSGKGEEYRVEGELVSDSLSTPLFYLKSLQGFATVKGKEDFYEASGRVLVNMLNAGDFKLNLLQATSAVRGTGSDLKWFFDLQSAAANSSLGTIVGLFIEDGVATYNEKKFSANIGVLGAQRFVSEDFQVESLLARNAKIDGNSNVNLPYLKASRFRTGSVAIENLSADQTQIRQNGEQIETKTLKAERLKTDEAILRDIRAENLRAKKNGEFTLEKAEAGSLDAGTARILGVQAFDLDSKQKGNETVINSKLVRVGETVTEQANIGSFNIAGVRISIRQGYVTVSSEDIDLGDAVLNKTAQTPQGGKLEKILLKKPIFILEPSGKYRASADIAIGGGNIGTVKLGTARTSLVLTSEQLELRNISAEVLDGQVTGNVTVAFNQGKTSVVETDFVDVDLAKLMVAQNGKVVPLSGKLNGKASLVFPQSDFKQASGIVTAKFQAKAGEENSIPVNGNLEIVGEKGLFSLKQANLQTEKSVLSASGVFDLKNEDSNLEVALTSSDATEIQHLITWFEVSPELNKVLAENKIQMEGKLSFRGKVTGNVENPVIAGNTNLETISMKNYPLGTLSADIFVSPNVARIQNGKLQQADGFINFDIEVPQPVNNNISVTASVNNFDIENLIAALPLESYVPEKLRKVKARTSGNIRLQGLPNEASGEVNLNSSSGSIAGEAFDSFQMQLNLNKALASLEKLEIRHQASLLSLKGTYDGETTVFDFTIEGKDLQASKLLLFAPDVEGLPSLEGTLNFRGRAKGEALETATYDINFEGTAKDFTINQNQIGSLDFQGFTEDKKLKATLAINLENQKQLVNAEVNFGDENLPLRIFSDLENANLAPYLAFYPNRQDVQLSGFATGKVLIEGNLIVADASGNKRFSFSGVKGNLNLQELSLQINEIPIVSKEPVVIRFDTREINFENAKFASAGSTLVISGTKALQDDVANNLSINGRVSLRLLDIVLQNAFLTGSAEVSVRLTGVNRDARLSGTAKVENASLSIFVGSEKLDFDRVSGNVIFTSNQVQISEASGYLGGGKVVASGGAVLNNLQLEGFRLDLVGRNVTAPLPKNFITTGNAEITITSRRTSEGFDTLIAGTIYARRSVYQKDIDLADIISSRREGSITEGGTSSFSVPRLDLVLIGREALIVRNNIADLVASADLRVTGSADSPNLTGRITANEGTLFYRNDQYTIRRGVLEFPTQTDREPFINLQTETEIQGYQISLELVGELSDSSSLSLRVSSNPALPQADIVSLITTGSLANTETGIPTTTQSGINTAAEILTDALVNAPIRRATDRLFGLNRFEINPVISDIRQIPTARLTVGRQINRNLLVTYSTNLSEDQRQVLALEYRVSNRLSFIAQYQQKSLNNFVRNRDSFSFEIRLRRRF